jgi:hypothetical protein
MLAAATKVKALVFKCPRHHLANGFIVIHKQYFMRNELFGGSYMARPFSIWW